MKNYGLFKQICDRNAYSSLAKTLSSAASTKKTQNSLKRITQKYIRYAHMGQLVIDKNGICYASFIQNPGNDTEHHYSETSGIVLAVFSISDYERNDFDPDRDVEFFKIGSMGEYCAGWRAASIFKDNSMCLVGEMLHVCFSFISDDGNSHIFRKTFDTKKKAWVDEAKIVLCYKGKNYDFSDASLNEIYEDRGLEPRAKGLIEMVSAWNEYKGEYYATGVAIEKANNGFVVKTRDFTVMELVDVIPFNDNGMAEVASYIFCDRLFVACRQDYGIPYLYLGSLNLIEMRWEHHYKIPDGNCRPWFFEREGELFLLNTVEERRRRYLNVSRVRTLDGLPQPFFNNEHPTELVATLKGCGSYIATAEYQGEIYFVVTLRTESFGKLTLKLYDEDKVNDKLISLFEEE